MPEINPTVLVQARKEAGFSLEEAAWELGLETIKVLQKLENGEKNPSEKQLNDISKFYGYPSLAFFLNTLPQRASQGEDFRTLSETKGLSFKDKRNLQTLLEKTAAQQSIAKELINDEQGQPIPWINSEKDSVNHQELALKIRKILKFSPDEYRNENPNKRFKLLRQKAEDSGVFIILAGVASHQKYQIGLNVFRGIALSDSLAPFILINDYENEPARVFTLLHEISHLLLGKSGVSGNFSTDHIEKLCNQAAASALLDEKDITLLCENWKAQGEGSLGTWSLKYGVSTTMAAYLLLERKLLDQKTYNEISKKQIQKRNKPKTNNTAKKGGPNYYVVRKNKIGNALVHLAHQALGEERLVPTKAAILLGVKPSSVYPLLESKPSKRKAVA